jgi:hypothetical protein
MHIARNKLLLSLVLLTLAGSVACSYAHAATLARGASIRSGIMVSTGGSIRPGPVPSSGEPDTGQQHPTPKCIGPTPGPDGGSGAPWSQWLRWIGRAWIMRPPGLF